MLDNVCDINREDNKLHYETKTNYIKNDSKKLFGTINYILWKKDNSAPSFIESDGSFITKPTDIANYFNLMTFSLAR